MERSISELRNEIINQLLLQVLDLKVRSREEKGDNYSVSLQAIKNITGRLEELERGEVSELTRKIYN